MNHKEIEIEWSQVAAAEVSGSLELTAGNLGAITIVTGTGTVTATGWQGRPDAAGTFRILVALQISPAIQPGEASILTVSCPVGSFSFFPKDVPVILREPRVLVIPAGAPENYATAAQQLSGVTMLERLRREPEWSAEIASQFFPAPPRSDLVLGMDRNWESFWVAPLGDRLSLEERDTKENEPNYDPYARLPNHQRHFKVGPVLPEPTVLHRGIEDNYLPILQLRYTSGAVECEITAFAGTLNQPMTATEPALAVFYEARLKNAGAVEFHLPPGLLASTEEPGKFQAKAWLTGGGSIYRVVMPYWPQPAAVLEAAAEIDFQQKHDEVRRYWDELLAGAMQLHVPEPLLNDSYKAALIRCLLRVYPGRYQAEAKPIYQYTPLAPDYGVWNGRFCPIASESLPMIHLFDWAGLPAAFVEACLQYYFNRQNDDGRLQVIFYDIETPWVLWGSHEHYRRTHDTAWAKRFAPQIIRACDWIITQRRQSYVEPIGASGRGLFAGHTADDPPEGGGRNFMFNGYMYRGLQAAGELLQAIGDPAGDRISADAALYRQDIIATVDECIRRAPVIRLGDGYWVPAVPPQHNFRGLANWNGFHSHGALYLHDAELGPLHMVYAGVLEAGDARTTNLLELLSEVVTRETGIAESQPAYSRHADVLLRRGDVPNFLRAFYALRFFQSDRETGTWWEHCPAVLGSPHKTHEEAWWAHQLREMLVLDHQGSLHLCAGIPRRWLTAGNQIRLTGANTPYGRLSFEVNSTGKQVTATVELESTTTGLTLRLPHPERRSLSQVWLDEKPWREFDPQTETISLPVGQSQWRIVAEYAR